MGPKEEVKEESFCKSCAYFIEMEPDHSSFNALFSDRYGCNLHKLYNGELSHPHWQSCEEHLSVISKLRDDKLKQLGIY